MGDFGDNPPKLTFLEVFGPLELNFWGDHIWYHNGFLGGLTSKFLDWSYGFEAKNSKN